MKKPLLEEATQLREDTINPTRESNNDDLQELVYNQINEIAYSLEKHASLIPGYNA